MQGERMVFPIRTRTRLLSCGLGSSYLRRLAMCGYIFLKSHSFVVVGIQ